MKINVKSKGTQPTCQMPFVLSCEHCFFCGFLCTCVSFMHIYAGNCIRLIELFWGFVIYLSVLGR